MQKLNIETSQHVKIDYVSAGVGARVGAFFIDLFILGIYFYFSLFVIIENIYSSTWVIILFVLLPVFFYHLLFEILLAGQSLGKKAVGIKVVKTDGTPATIGSYLLRWMFRLVEITATSGLLAFFAILINGQGQRLGDMAAGTTVVKVKSTTSLSDTLYTDIEEGYNPVYEQAANLSDNDISLIKEVLDEGDKYDDSTHLKMLRKTSNAIQRKMGTEKGANINSVTFLRTVIKDYNYLRG